MTKAKPAPGTHVILLGLPKKFLDDLPKQDRNALTRAVGKRWLLDYYDEDGRAVLTFWASKLESHTVLVDPEFIQPAPEG